MVVYLICTDIESFIKHEVLISTSWHAHVHCTHGAHGAMCAMMYRVQCVPWCTWCNVCSILSNTPSRVQWRCLDKEDGLWKQSVFYVHLCSMCIYVLCEAMCYVQLYASMCYVHIVQLSCARFRWFS